MILGCWRKKGKDLRSFWSIVLQSFILRPMKDSGQGKSGGLDLGLGVLAKGKENEVVAPVSVAPSPRVEAPALEKQPELELLSAEARWKEVIAKAEARLAVSTTDIEARLYWVRAQLSTAAVPSSILAAPLEAVTQELSALLKSKPDQCPKAWVDLLVSLLADVGQRLRQASDYGPAEVLLQHAYNLDSKQSHALRRCLQERLQVIETLPRKKSEDQAEEARINQILAGLPRDSAPISNPGFVSGSAAEAVVPVARRSSGINPWFVVLVLLGVIAGLSWYVYQNFIGSRARTALMSSEVGVNNPELVAPQPEKVSSLPNLDAIFYNLGLKEKPASPVGPGNGGDKKGEVSAPVANVNSQGVLNTKGPKEPEDIRELRERGPEPSTSATNNDGRTDPRRIMDQAQLPLNSQAPIRLHRVLVKTRVMATPDFQGKVLVELNPGDRLLVEGAEGNWYKIRSKGGKVAYVLRQDVEELKE